MNIPIEILELRNENFTKGDNEAVAREASKGTKKFTAQQVANAIRSGRAPHAKIVLALHKYYTNKTKGIRSLSNVEMSQ